MKITKELSCGVKKDTPKELLYIDKIILCNYKEPNKVKAFMETLNNFKIFQYNYTDSKTSDYFFWQYVDNENKKNWQSVEICCYQNNMESVYKMLDLYRICEKAIKTDVEVIVKYNDIRNLIEKIKTDVLFEMNKLKNIFFDIISDDYDEMIEKLRSLNTNKTITDEEYDIITEKWDEWLKEYETK